MSAGAETRHAFVRVWHCDNPLRLGYSHVIFTHSEMCKAF